MDTNETFGQLKNLEVKLKKILSGAKCVDDLFTQEVSDIREEMSRNYESLMWMKPLGLKAFQLIWLANYYGLISYGKKKCLREFSQYKIKHEISNARDILCHSKLPIGIFTNFRNMRHFLVSAIQDFQYLIIQLANKYKINLKYYLKGFMFIRNFNDELGKYGMFILEKRAVDAYNFNVNKNVPESELTQYGLTLLSTIFVAIGDVHRYIMDLDLNAYMNNPTDWCDTTSGNNSGVITFVSSENLRFINREYVKNLYFMAFQLNPSNGMAQNQIGTLVIPQNNGIDAVFHYMFAIYNKKELPAKANLNSIFIANENKIIDKCSLVTVSTIEDLHILYIWIIDIAYNKKKIEDLQSLCSEFIQTMPYFLELGLITENCLLKMISIILMCMEGDDLITAYLIAFLYGIGFCMVKSCNNNYEKFVHNHTDQGIPFNQTYMQAYTDFQNVFKQKRAEYRLHKRAFYRYQQENKKVNQQPQMDQHKKELLLKKPTLPTFSSPLPLTLLANRTPLNEVIHHVYIDSTGSSVKMHRVNGNKQYKKKSNQKNARSRRRARVRHSSINYNSSSDECDLPIEKDTTIDKPVIEGISGSSREGDIELISGDSTSMESMFILSSEYDDDDDDDDVSASQPETQEEREDVPQEEELEEAAAAAAAEKRFKNNHHDDSDDELSSKFYYIKPYIKIDPNIIIKFAMSEPTLKGLKIIFDWIKLNQEEFKNAYATNPELIHQIMILINYLHLDIFSERIYFNRTMLDIPHLRNDLETLANNNANIPLDEDTQLKHLSIIKCAQRTLDWNSPIEYNTTQNEEIMLRLLKISDFGHHVSQIKIFDYNFCFITRTFMLNTDIQSLMASQNLPCEPEENNNNNNNNENNNNNNENNNNNNEMYEPEAIDHHLLHSLGKHSELGSVPQNVPENFPEPTTSEAEKSAIMGRLWLEHEVNELERKVQTFSLDTLELEFHPTPYVVVDSATIASYFNLVRKIIEKENCIVLIPLTVLSELDELKKSSTQARTAIRYFEIKFQVGNRFVRVQRKNESSSITTVKAVTKMDRKTLEYLHIAKFCKYMIESEKKFYDNPKDIITLLTGQPIESISQSKIILDLLNSVGVNYTEIKKFRMIETCRES